MRFWDSVLGVKPSKDEIMIYAQRESLSNRNIALSVNFFEKLISRKGCYQNTCYYLLIIERDFLKSTSDDDLTTKIISSAY